LVKIDGHRSTMHEPMVSPVPVGRSAQGRLTNDPRRAWRPA
jgi:hypothetical protein